MIGSLPPIKIDTWIAAGFVLVAAAWSLWTAWTWRQWRRGVDQRMDQIIDLQEEQAERGRSNGEGDEGPP